MYMTNIKYTVDMRSYNGCIYRIRLRPGHVAIHRLSREYDRRGKEAEVNTEVNYALNQTNFKAETGTRAYYF